MNQENKDLLLACLVALIRRAHGGIVIEEALVREAQESSVKIRWERDTRTGTIRLAVPDMEAWA